jgi:excinuclease UvrABC helicase subunit UvrB
MTAPFTIHDEIARLQTEIEEAKKRLEFEHAFKLIAKLEALQEQDGN